MPTQQKAGEFLEECMKNEDSSGGSIECVIQNMPAGIGEPVFEKLSANLGKAILSIGAVKAFEIGDGTAVAHALGHINNDQYTRNPDGKIIKLTNHSGGILGGISDGSDILCVYPSNRRLRSQENSPPSRKTEAADRFL